MGGLYIPTQKSLCALCLGHLGMNDRMAGDLNSQQPRGLLAGDAEQEDEVIAASRASPAEALANS